MSLFRFACPAGSAYRCRVSAEPVFPHHDASQLAKERVQIGPVPDWVAPCKVPVNYRGQQKRPLTYLLVSRQIHAELNQTFVHFAVRLETMEAVQHESQWRLQLEPASQTITLHWIRIRRGEAVFEHARSEQFRLLQREEGLDKFVIDGWFTLLLLLEDVRPGDILETCYTLTSKPRLLPECCASFFNLPFDSSVGHFRFSVQFRNSRPLKWKSGSATLQPVEALQDDGLLWIWSGDDFSGAELEPNTPEWHLPPQWVQISDCPDWQTAATALAKAWSEQSGGPAIEALAAEIEGSETDLVARADRAIQLVQDDYRYLSVNLDLGGTSRRLPSS